MLYKNKIIISVIFLPLLFLNCICLGQNTEKEIPKNALVIQPQIYFGKLVKIYPEFPSSDFINFNELNIAWQTTGNKEWHQLYRYPQIGISFVHGYFDNNRVLGQSISLIPNIAFETNNEKRWSFQTRLGLGLSYFTKYYDVVNNPTNNVIGSSITNITFLSENLNYKLSKSLNINVGIAAFHCSNGHYQLPNLGANLPAINVGISYFPSEIPSFYKHDSIQKRTKKILFTITAGYGRHEFGTATKATGGPKYPVFQGAFYLSKRFRKISSLQAGLFYTYYSDYYDFIINQEYFDSRPHLKASVITLFLGHEFIIGKIGIVAQCGYNAYTPFQKKFHQLEQKTKDYAFIYITNKVGIQYYISDPTKRPKHNLFIGMFIKAHFGVADFAQLSTGYTF